MAMAVMRTRTGIHVFLNCKGAVDIFWGMERVFRMNTRYNEARVTIQCAEMLRAGSTCCVYIC